MEVTLYPSLAKFVEEQVLSGRYSSPEEVINAALHALQVEQDIPGGDLRRLRAELQLGLDEANRGDSEDWDLVELRTEGQRLFDEARKRAI